MGTVVDAVGAKDRAAKQRQHALGRRAGAQAIGVGGEERGEHLLVGENEQPANRPELNRRGGPPPRPQPAEKPRRIPGEAKCV